MTLFGIPTDRGLIRTILIVVVALLILSYFGYNLRDIASSPTTKDNFSFVTEVISDVWNNYLKRPATYIWNFFVDLIWEPAVDNLTKMKNGEDHDLVSGAPTIPVEISP